MKNGKFLGEEVDLMDLLFLAEAGCLGHSSAMLAPCTRLYCGARDFFSGSVSRGIGYLRCRMPIFLNDSPFISL